MRIVMQALTLAMCGAALLAFGVAKAGESREDGFSAPPGYVVVDADAQVPGTTPIHSFDMIDENTVVFRAGSDRTYLVELGHGCGEDLVAEPNISFDISAGGVDRFSTLRVNGQRCSIIVLARIARAPDGGAGLDQNLLEPIELHRS